MATLQPQLGTSLSLVTYSRLVKSTARHHSPSQSPVGVERIRVCVVFVLLWDGRTTGTHIQFTVCWVGLVAVKGVTPVVCPVCPRNLWSFLCPTGNGHFWDIRQTLGIFGIMTKVWAFLVHMVKLWGIFGIIPFEFSTSSSNPPPNDARTFSTQTVRLNRPSQFDWFF